MTADYQIRVYDPTTGACTFVSGLDRNIRTINITHRVNYPSTLTIGTWGGYALKDYLTLDALVEIRRTVPEAGLDWYTEYVGFHRTPQRQVTTADNRIFTAYNRGLMDLLKRRSIRWYADTAGSDKGPAPADDVMKEFVYENAGAGATIAAGRVSEGVAAGLSVAANVGDAPDYSGAHAWKNLLRALQEIGEPTRVDFDVVWGGESSPLTFTFETYYPQLGTDRREGGSNPFIFAPLLGNMADPSYTQSRTEEISSALVLGPGNGPLRDTTLVDSAHTADSPWNLIEEDVNASGEDRAAALQAIGEELIYEKRPAISFTFSPIQTPESTYGKHFFLGDIVTGRFEDVAANVKIQGLSLSVSDGRERLSFELVEIPE